MKKAKPMENKPPTRSQKRCQQRKTAMQNLRGMFEMLEESHKMDKTNMESPPQLDLFY